jgi:hypothetical protein
MIKAILDYLKTKPVIILSTEKFEDLLEEIEVVEEQDTYFRDKIRILRKDDIILIQEKAKKDEIIIRKVESVEKGSEFIEDRLKIYEKMWNGCGCKIDYYK